MVKETKGAGPPQADEPPQAVAIFRRLAELDWGRPDLVRAAKINEDTLTSVLFGRRKTYPSTQHRIEGALSWPIGTIARLQDGRLNPDDVRTVETTLAVDRSPDSPPRRVTLTLDVSQAQWQKLSPEQQSEAVLEASDVIRRIAERHGGDNGDDASTSSR